MSDKITRYVIDDPMMIVYDNGDKRLFVEAFEQTNVFTLGAVDKDGNFIAQFRFTPSQARQFIQTVTDAVDRIENYNNSED
jgi:hypothetical protein